MSRAITPTTVANIVTDSQRSADMEPCPVMRRGFEAATKFHELLAGPEAMFFSLRHNWNEDKGIRLFGTVAEHWPRVETEQANGYGAFVIINMESRLWTIRAFFVDGNNVSIPSTWHLCPDFIVLRDSNHWQAYWIAVGPSLDQFRNVQTRLAAYYGTDPNSCEKHRLMRIPGTFHQETKESISVPYYLVDYTGSTEPALLGHSIEEICTGLPSSYLMQPTEVELDTEQNIQRGRTYLIGWAAGEEISLKESQENDEAGEVAYALLNMNLSPKLVFELLNKFWKPCVPS